MFIFSITGGHREVWPQALEGLAAPLTITQDILSLIKSSALNSPEAQVDVFLFRSLLPTAQ
jgi:hypothetical protein